MKVRGVLYAPQARQDLAAIRSYLRAEAGVGVANRTLAQIKAKECLLCEFPKSGAPREDLHPGGRMLVMAPYVIIYEVLSTRVHILRVLHGARDLPDVMDE